MLRRSKELLKADRFRARATEILKDADWLDEGVRHWLHKELGQPSNYIYSDNEHAALSRIIAASTLFDGWDGYSVPELKSVAYRYKADGSEEDERLLDELESKVITQLRLAQMGHLVGFCRNVAGLYLTPFRPEILTHHDVS